MSLTLGTRLGIYEVTAKIGEGGMGEVYQARDTTLDRDVALKVLPEAFTADPDRLARFQREAKVLASLNHPNIGAIYGLEAAGDTQALVLELIEGPTLADRIAEGAIPVDEALTIAKQIAEALEAAHEQGIVHRDLKPANVKVRPDGTVKVLDFGLAKAVTPEASGTSGSESPTMSLTEATQMGMVIGTAAYMAPEQAKGKPVDKRADIWAFGVVLLEMLVGKRVFEGETASETLAAVMMKEPDWGRLPTDLPPKLDNLVRRCLEKDPRERVRDVGDVRLAMAGAFETTVSARAETVTVAPQKVWQHPVSIVGAVLASLVVGGVGVWSLTRPVPLRVARFPVPLISDQSFSYTGRPVVAISPDGTQVVYAANRSLWLRPLDQLQAIQVAGTETEARGPFFSADGQSIGFWAAGQLKKVSVSGGAPVTLADVPTNPSGASWSADDMVLYGQPEGIMQVPGASGTPELLIPVAEGEFIHGPQMLPDGEWVLFTVRGAGQASWDAAQIVAQSITTNERTVLISGGRDGRYVPSGHLVYGLNGVLFAVPFDVNSRQVAGGPVPLVEDVRQAVGIQNGAAQFSVSSNGSLVYVPGSAGGGNLELAWLGLNGAAEAIPAPPNAIGHPRVSPDGTQVAVDIDDGANTDVWIWNLERETLTRLTFDAAADAYPVWAPDGSRVVFQSGRDGGGLFWKAADGTGEVERLWESTATPRPYAWSADDRLVFSLAPGDIGVLAMEGERTVEMLLDTEFREIEPALSPDGRWLAYTSNETGQSEIYVRPFPDIDDGKWQISTNLGFDTVWSPEGDALYFVTPAGIFVTGFETEPTVNFETPTLVVNSGGAFFAGTGRQYDIAPSGERFIVRTVQGAQTDDDGFNGLIVVENWFEELKARAPAP